MGHGGAVWLAFILMIMPAAGQEGPRPPAPCTGATAMGADRLREVTPEGDLVLETAGRARLAGVRLPDDGSLRAEAFALLRSAAGRPVVVEGRPERDRWSRIPVVIRPDEPSPSADFAYALVEAGLAVVDPASSIPFCRTDLLLLEQEARKRSLGVWGDDRYKPIEAGDAERLRTSVGRFVLVEGRVRSIGERSQRVYLNFGEHWAEDFTIVIPRQTWKLMGERGLDAAALKGQRIRARGILEPWQGTSLTLLMPEMIERLAGSRLPR
ncbi:thermonuclease family protein [Microvirga subterranea]|uniref:Endonuclease YncB(Thermonuclease family) n=1 Tax=Microvirga subterranea TaxID=186651 RepID=A0A370HTU5_9HYPH|nr:DNA-binding protein [Microvirga subterranea]RDI61949.1 endonuclease YncB(thermonuclease family) [Microvirga subterranea]